MDSSKTETAGRRSQLLSSKTLGSLGRSVHAMPGESRIEYVPIEKTVIQYQPITKVEYIPREKKVVEYQPIEYQVEYIPQIYYEKVVDYVPVERMEERIQYVPVQRQIYHPTQHTPHLPYENSYPSAHPVSSQRRALQPRVNTTSRIQTTQQQEMSFQNTNSEYIKQPLPSSKRSKRG